MMDLKCFMRNFQLLVKLLKKKRSKSYKRWASSVKKNQKSLALVSSDGLFEEKFHILMGKKMKKRKFQGRVIGKVWSFRVIERNVKDP